MVYSPSAEALTEWDYCSGGNDDLSAGTRYLRSGTGWRVYEHHMTITGNTAGENNLTARLRHRTNNPVYWTWSRSNIRGGQTYSPDPNVSVPNASEFYTQAIFDQNGSDPNCYTLITLDGIDQSP